MSLVFGWTVYGAYTVEVNYEVGLKIFFPGLLALICGGFIGTDFCTALQGWT